MPTHLPNKRYWLFPKKEPRKKDFVPTLRKNTTKVFSMPGRTTWKAILTGSYTYLKVPSPCCPAAGWVRRMPDRFATGGKTLCVCGRTQRHVPMGRHAVFFCLQTLCMVILIWVQGRKRLVLDGVAASHGRPRRTSKRGDKGRGFGGLLTDNAVHGQPRRGMSVLWTVTPRPSSQGDECPFPGFHLPG